MKKFIIATILILGIIPNFDGNITLVSEVNAQMMAYEFPGEDDCFGGDTGLGYGHCSVCGGCYDARYDSCPWCGGQEKEDPLKDYDTCLRCNETYKISRGHKCTYNLCMDCGVYFDPFSLKAIEHRGHQTLPPRY